MAHTLLSPVTEITVKHLPPSHRYNCSCGGWTRVYAPGFEPPLQDVESSHETHRREASAEDLRTGRSEAARSAEKTFLATLKAMADVARASVEAAEAMQEFLDAYQEASGKGIGVVVVRHKDGSTSSTPNIFVPNGSAIFMDEPDRGMPPLPIVVGVDPVKPYPWTMVAQPNPPVLSVIDGGLTA